MQNQSFLSRKNIILFCLGVLLIFGAIFCFTNTVVVFENIGEEKTVEIRGEDESLKTFKLSGKKWMVLPRGGYSVSVTSDYRYSSYSPSLGSFYKKLFIETAPQKQSSHLGPSDFGCFAGAEDRPFFFPCENYFGSVEIMEASEAKLIEVDPVAAKHDHEPGEAEAQNASLSFAAAPLDGRLLSLRAEDNKLTAKSVDAYKLDGATKVELSSDFQGQLKNRYLSVAPSGSFAVFDESKRAILVFENLNDDEPQIVTLEKELSDVENGKAVMVALSNDRLFVTLSKSFDALDEVNEEEFSRYEDASQKTKLFMVDLKDSQKISDYVVPGSVIAKNISVSADGVLVIIPQYEENRPAYEFTDGRFRELSLPGGVYDACWVGDHLFVSTSDDQIFDYSFDKEGSFLAYESQWGSLVDMNCGNGLQFGVVAEGQVATNSAALRFLLTDKESKGPRLDGVLPFYYTYKADTYLVGQTGESVSIGLNYDSDGNGPSPKDEVKAKVLEELKTKTRIIEAPSINTTF